jgi:ComF family protein
MGYAALLREYLFPMNCAICGRMLFDRRECRYGLCRTCLPRLELDLEPPRCPACGRPLISEQGLCASCRRDGSRFRDQTLALYPYTGEYRKLLTAFKFEKRRDSARFLGEKLVESLGAFSEALYGAVLTPVPPRAGKLRQTGWDQIACLASVLEHLGKRMEMPPVYRCLERLPSRSQKGLSGELRGINLRGRIHCIRKAPRRAVVFDDVITTGSTLEACAEALKRGGAERVYGLCLFYTC